MWCQNWLKLSIPYGPWTPVWEPHVTVVNFFLQITNNHIYDDTSIKTCKIIWIFQHKLYVSDYVSEFQLLMLADMLLLSTHSLDPWLWGESDHPAFGPPVSLSLHLVSSFITPTGSVHKSRGDSVVRMWVQLKIWCVSCVWLLQWGNSGDGCGLASSLCKYDLRKEYSFVLSWARVRRVRQGSISSVLLMCGGGVRSILLLHLVARCLETIDVCIWRLGVLKYVVSLCSECDGCYIFVCIVRRGSVGARVWAVLQWVLLWFVVVCVHVLRCCGWVCCMWVLVLR